MTDECYDNTPDVQTIENGYSSDNNNCSLSGNTESVSARIKCSLGKHKCLLLVS